MKFGLLAEKLSNATGIPVPPPLPAPAPKVQEIQQSGLWCFYCGIKLVPPPPKQLPPRWQHLRIMRTRDHVIPRCKKPEKFLTVDCCHLCNQIKGEKDLEEFRAFVAMLMHKPMIVFHGEKKPR